MFTFEEIYKQYVKPLLVSEDELRVDHHFNNKITDFQFLMFSISISGTDELTYPQLVMLRECAHALSELFWTRHATNEEPSTFLFLYSRMLVEVIQEELGIEEDEDW